MRSECGRVVGGCLACDRGVEGLGGYVSFTNGVNTQSVDRVGVMATQGHMTDELEKCGDYEVMCMFHLVLLSHDAATPTCLRGPLWEEKTQLQQESTSTCLPKPQTLEDASSLPSILAQTYCRISTFQYLILPLHNYFNNLQKRKSCWVFTPPKISPSPLTSLIRKESQLTESNTCHLIPNLSPYPNS
jgi:hypothetical protein